MKPKDTEPPCDELLAQQFAAANEKSIDNELWRAFSRRRLVQALGVSGSIAAQGLTLGGALGAFSRTARADGPGPGPNDDHYFIFVELAGAFNWPMAIDARSPDLVKAGPATNFEPIDVRKSWTKAQFDAIKTRTNFTQENGGGCFMAFDSTMAPSWEQSVTLGKTGLGLDYALGFCGGALKPYVDQMAVVRGVKMAGDFHGKGNSSDDIWSGSKSGDHPHVASVLSALLEQKNGAMPLDNIVLENGFFPENLSVGAKSAIRTDGRTLGSLLGSFAAANTISGASAADRFRRFTNVATSILNAAKPKMTAGQADIMGTYIGKFAPALAVQGKLLSLGNKLAMDDISLDLKAQFDLAFTLMEANLTRVITLCLGAPNTTNKADPNGLFDAHTGLYTAPTPPDNSTENNWVQVTKTVESIAGFIDRLAKLDDAHPLKNKITVCISSEFTRQGGLNGNERSSASGDGFVHFGGGHNLQNNNYLFFGKNVRGGAWMGRAGITSLVRYDVDFAKLQATSADKVMDDASGVFLKPANDASVTNTRSEPPVTAAGGKRGFAARDMVRTALALAGFDDKYSNFYSREDGKDAVAVTQVKA